MDNNPPSSTHPSLHETDRSGRPADHVNPDDGAYTTQQTSNSSQYAHERRYVGAPIEHGPLDMNSVAAALPSYQYRQQPPTVYQQQFPHPTQNAGMTYPYPVAQYSNAMPGNYPVPFPSQMHHQAYPSQRVFATYPVNPNMMTVQQMYPGQQYYSQQPTVSSSMQTSFPPAQQGPNYGQGQGTMYNAHSPNQYRGMQLRVDNFNAPTSGNQMYLQNEMQNDIRKDSTSSLKVPSTLRGPPRKPKQSGHALWVGNLPPGTNIMDLKDHFSRDATEDIESVFLISKSNCAFVNYRSEQSCTSAMARFHDSRFNGVRLVCRLRRGSSPTSSTVPISLNTGATSSVEDDSTSDEARVIAQEAGGQRDAEDMPQPLIKIKERYFVIKSLTIEDLERSVQSGIWATQSHNEDALNRAFHTAENVYLIFSANKSGEYFGYARMDSTIDNESLGTADSSAAELQSPPHILDMSATEIPMTIPTPSTASAPRGYIIDDSARGTIFWEAENQAQLGSSLAIASPANTESGEVSGDEAAEQQLKPPSHPDSPNPSTTFGKPFKITWLSTERLPFYRTRGLKNPWNTNREVKIARDGTEIEPSVGKKLVSMFHMGAAMGRTQQPGHYPENFTMVPGQGPTYRPY